MPNPSRYYNKTQLKDLFREYNVPLVRAVDSKDFNHNIPHKHLGNRVLFKEEDVWSYVNKYMKGTRNG